MKICEVESILESNILFSLHPWETTNLLWFFGTLCINESKNKRWKRKDCNNFEFCIDVHSVVKALLVVVGVVGTRNVKLLWIMCEWFCSPYVTFCCIGGFTFVWPLFWNGYHLFVQMSYSSKQNLFDYKKVMDTAMNKSEESY